MNEDDLSRVIVQSAIEVHRTLGGPGLIAATLAAQLAAVTTLMPLDEFAANGTTNETQLTSDQSLWSPFSLPHCSSVDHGTACFTIPDHW